MAFPGNLSGMSDPNNIIDVMDARRYIQELQNALVDLASQLETQQAATTVEGTEFPVDVGYDDSKLQLQIDDLKQRWSVLNPPDTIPGHFRYQYDQTTTKSDPGSGFFRLDDTVISTSGELYINETTHDGMIITDLLDNIGPDVFIYIAQESNPTRALLLQVTDWTDETGWYTIGYNVSDWFDNDDGEWEDTIICTFIFPMAEEILYQMSIDEDDDGLKFVNDEEDPGDPTFYGCDGAVGAVSKGWKLFTQITVVTNVQYDATAKELQIKTRTAYVFDPGIESAWTKVTGWVTTVCS